MTNSKDNQPRVSYLRSVVIQAVRFALDCAMLLPLLILALCARLVRRPIDVGIGPLPIINGIYHKKCLQHCGYSCETYTDDRWHITQDFDLRFEGYFPSKLRLLMPYVIFVVALFRYKCVYVYFSGGPLRATTLLARLEPILFSLANVRTVVMAFGMDVNELTRTPNRGFVAALARDYPWFRHQRRRVAALIDTWTRGADYVVAGGDWIDYLYYWDRAVLSHFAVDISVLAPDHSESADAAGEAARPLRVLHAPNHRHLKGTSHIVAAVQELKAEGVAIELELVEGVPNTEVHRAILNADVVVDQLVIGWYAMFAIEGMAMGKPVVCHLRQDLVDFYVAQGNLAGRDEIAIIDASTTSIKQVLRGLASIDRRQLRDIGRKSREYVERHHSIPVIASVFAEINRSLGIVPSGTSTAALSKGPR